MDLYHEDLSEAAFQEQTVSQKRTVIGLMIFGAFVVASSIMLINFSTHSLSVAWIYTKSVIGMAGESDYQELSKICLSVNKLDCAEDAYRAVANLNGADNERKHEVGHFLFLREKYEDSLAYYNAYFALGGKNLDAAYDYARLLSLYGDREKSSEYFLMVINAKQDVLQHTVAANYVDHLIKYNERDKALSFMRKWRSKGDNTSGFLEEQWRRMASN